MEVLIIGFHLAVITALAYIIWRNDHDLFFWPALMLKLLCGILVGLLYKYYYATGDTWGFYEDAVKVANALIENPKLILDFSQNDDFTAIGGTFDNDRPRSVFFIKWVTAFNLIGGNSYWVTSLYFSFISFYGSWVLYRTLRLHRPVFKSEAAIAVLFVPSVVFWGSGIIKESLALATLYLITAGFISWYYTRAFTISKFVGVLILSWILWNLKYYWLAVWLAVVAPTLAVRLLSARLVLVRENPTWSWLFFLVAAFAGISIIHPNFYYDQLFKVILDNHNAFIKISNTDDVIHFYELEPSALSLLINSPWALFSSLFRPFIFESGNLLKIAVSVENMVLFFLFLVVLFRWRKLFVQVKTIHLALLVYVLFMGIFLALSTPNFGTLSRFRIGLTPFLWYALLCESGILRKFNFLHRTQSSGLNF